MESRVKNEKSLEFHKMGKGAGGKKKNVPDKKKKTGTEGCNEKNVLNRI